MAYATGEGTKFYYCATANPTADTISEYAALTWVELVGVETISEFGDSAAAVNYTLLAEGRVRKGKGAKDAGDITVTCIHDPLVASQQAMVGFSKTKFNYAFKEVAADAADGNDTDSVFYFAGKVMSARYNRGDANNPSRRNYVIAIDTEILEDPGNAVSGG